MKKIALLAPLFLTGCCLCGGGRRSSAVTPAPAPVAAKPEPAPAPAPVKIAAGEKVTIELEVKFDTDKDAVKPEYDGQLRKVADFLAAHPETRAEIEGHTDSQGDAAYNKALSQRRADAVRQALIDRFGSDASRLTAAGYGLEKPRASNDDAEGRARNRRVIATFTGAN